jgi:hypothetical protein
MYIFAVAATDAVVRDSETAYRIESGFSSIVRYATGRTVGTSRGWRFYRRDSGGSSRQHRSESSLEEYRFVEEESFVCYPNPVRGNHVTVRVILSNDADVTVRMLNIEGEKVFESRSTHAWGEGSRVPFEERISVEKISSGIYICIMEVAGEGWSWRGARKFAVIR